MGRMRGDLSRQKASCRKGEAPNVDVQTFLKEVQRDLYLSFTKAQDCEEREEGGEVL